MAFISTSGHSYSHPIPTPATPKPLEYESTCCKGPRHRRSAPAVRAELVSTSQGWPQHSSQWAKVRETDRAGTNKQESESGRGWRPEIIQGWNQEAKVRVGVRLRSDWNQGAVYSGRRPEKSVSFPRQLPACAL